MAKILLENNVESTKLCPNGQRNQSVTNQGWHAPSQVASSPVCAHGAQQATCLVQRGLCDGVLLDEQAVLVGDEQPEDAGQGGGGDLELEHVVVSLPLHAAREVALEELLHWIQVGKQVFLWGSDFHRDNVAISKPR